MNAPDTKVCANCGETFARKRGFSAAIWERTRCCSQRCGQTLAHREHPRPPRDRVAAVDRVLARVRVHVLGCWEFTGALVNGYGSVQLGRGLGTDKAHRIVYRDLVGPIPDGLTLDHLCLNPRCVNPAHLEPVTRAENARRQGRAGRSNGGKAQKLKTHCPQGHPYAGENLSVRSGSRCCRACDRARRRRVARDVVA